MSLEIGSTIVVTEDIPLYVGEESTKHQIANRQSWGSGHVDGSAGRPVHGQGRRTPVLDVQGDDPAIILAFVVSDMGSERLASSSATFFMTREQVAAAVRAALKEQREWWLVPKERRCSAIRVTPDEQGKRVVREFGSSKEARDFLWNAMLDAAVSALAQPLPM